MRVEAELGCLYDGLRATDTGNADRLVKVANGTIRYVPVWGSWIVYRGGVWHLDHGDALVAETAKGVARKILTDLGTIESRNEIDDAFKWAKRCESAASIAAMIKLARGMPSVVTSHEDLDADPWLLNCVNGTIDLRTGTLREHNPDDLCTIQSPAIYDPAAQAPEFEAVVERALPDPEVRGFLQRLAGSACTGIPVQALVFAVGGGGNSKSVIMGALERALGNGYAVTPHKSLLVVGRHEQHPTHLASLRGARLIVASETEAGDRLNEELIKSLTGGDALRARRMREDEWSFRPTWTAVMHTNHPPRIRGTDEGIWRRVHQIPFDVAIPENERDDTLPERLATDELSGILNWMIEGCLAWQQAGRRLNAPDAVRAATDAYRAEQDHLGRFMEARCVVGMPGLVATNQALRQAYESWCASEGEAAWSAKAVSSELKRRGFIQVKHGAQSVRAWAGFGLQNTPSDPPESPY